IIYDKDDAISIPNGAKAILRCHASKFETISTCIDGNWDPPSLGYCNNEEQESFPVVAKRQEHHQQQQQQHSSKHPTNSGCPTLEAPSHSFLTYSPLSMAPYPTGTMANLNCFIGFSPIGQTAAECKDGEWSSIGNCQPVSVQRCPPIPAISHGMINYIPGGNGPYDYGSIAELTCGFGHSVAGNNRVTCESAGWAPTIGHCEQ
uniref:Sushi domain-containing protein n=1 Tax=Panagrolaimus sp. PS1159 TaxID=55785 RepID=A0AC35EU38_9BILA